MASRTPRPPRSGEHPDGAGEQPTHKIIGDLEALAVPITNLVEAPDNPRRGDVEAIARSFRVFGQRKPLVARRTGADEHGRPVGIVEAGNHGLKAARDELGWSHVAVVWVDEDETTAAAFGLADNRIPELGAYDQTLLVAQLERIAVDADLLAASAYSEEDLARLLAGDDAGDEIETEPIGWGIFDVDEVVATAFAHYRRTGLPFKEAPAHECMQELNALAATEGDKLVETTLGYRVADTYHPHRFDAVVEGRKTVLDVFDSDKYLEHALRLIVAQGKRVDDASLMATLPYVAGAQAASNFRPGFALSMLRRFAFDDATILDTSTGYGGRLVAFLASTCARYVGIDPNTVTCDSNRRMADELGAGKVVELHCAPAEDVELPEASADFAFTSPPYFAKERYSDEPTQSCNRYRSGPAWRDGFLRPMMALQARTLRPGAWSVVNVADVKLGAHSYPLVDWTITAGQDAGFELVRRERFPLGGRVPGQGAKRASWEPCLVFRLGSSPELAQSSPELA